MFLSSSSSSSSYTIGDARLRAFIVDELAQIMDTSSELE